MIAVDTHTHSIASGHAYSTLEELAKAAAAKGVQGFVLTDHSPGMPGGAHPYHFYNSRILPRNIHGSLVYRGIEANIINDSGEIDIDGTLSRAMEVVIASLHIPTITPGSLTYNTNAYVNAMRNHHVDIIGHPDDSRYPYDIPRFVSAAHETGTVIEINNSSLSPVTSRQGGEQTYRRLLKECREQKAPITLASDAHFSAQVGDVTLCMQLIEELDYPKELIINLTLDRFISWLENLP